MKRVSSFLLLGVLGVSLCSLPSWAGDIRHTFANSNQNSFYIDDRGGSVQNGGNNLTYYLNYKDVDESAFGSLFLYSKVGSATAVVDNGFDNSFGAGDFGSPSGIFLRPLSVLKPSLNGEIGLGSASLLTPVGFQGINSGLQVQQVSYTSTAPGDRFVIVEYRIVNPSGPAKQVKIGLANDFDVDQKSIDALEGYDASPVPYVYQQEGLPLDPNFTTVGVSLIEGTESQHRMEICNGPLGSCAIFANDGDVSRRAFFEGDQVGDLTGGTAPQDFAVSIAANLGTLQPGQGKSAVFVYCVGQGVNSVLGQSDLEQCLSAAKNFYETNLQVCSNGLVNFGEQCDDANTSNQDDCPSGLGATCQKARCGDGFLWIEGSGTEECDDGNIDNTDSCTNSCKFAQCGDGFVQPSNGEQCDLGAGNNNNGACTTLCQNARCGDGFLQPGEVCDDGNNNNGDGCAADCKSIETCGNGVVNPPFEQCDDGNNSLNDACPDGLSGTCQPAFCGDGFVFNGPGGSEECDDGNNINGDGCSATCQLENPPPGPTPAENPPPAPPPVCGNGIAEEGEQCDDGNDSNGDECSTTCEWIPTIQGGQSTGGIIGGCALNAGNAENLPGSTLWVFGFGFLLILAGRTFPKRRI